MFLVKGGVAATRKLTVLTLLPLTELTSLGMGLCGVSSEVRCTAGSGLLAWSADPMLEGLIPLWELGLAAALLRICLFALDRFGIGFRDITRGFGCCNRAMSMDSTRYILRSQLVVGLIVVGRVSVDVSI